MSLKPVPLFNLQELIAAFRLILSEEEAERCAREWFATIPFEEDINSSGYYLYRDWEGDEDPDQEPDAVVAPDVAADADGTRGYDFFRGRSYEEKAEFLLRFSDFHLSLLSLVSPELSRRVQRLRGDSDEIAARSRTQIQHLVHMMRE